MDPATCRSWKICVDGAVSRGAMEGTYNAVCRDSTEKYLGSSAIKCQGVTDPTSLEALSFREALSLALDLSHEDIQIASDCQGVIKDIHENMSGLHSSIIKEISLTSHQFSRCSFIYEGRKTNLKAHSLAKLTLGLSEGRHLGLLQPRTHLT